MNHLSQENSPYLLQHANNPIEWYPWGDQALARARAEDKPIFLSIGYAACHWCHVMAHESFEDAEIAAILNQHFISIKVDREERPDLDAIYMQAVVAMTGQGGWPLNVFLTPDLQPFFGGTYFPPHRRYNLPSFGEVLQTIARLWREDRPSLLKSSAEIAAHLRQQSMLRQDGAVLRSESIPQAVLNLAQAYDWKNGGWGSAPKFPQPMTVEFLLRRASGGDKFAAEIAAHALHAMAQGGMYDLIGGGFARYSTDAQWLVPHFEKMLYDNALLALAYLHGWLITAQARFRQVCEQTLDFIIREMTHEQGGFYSSLDADSEGQEGKYYVWTPEEIRQAIPNEQEAELALAAYGVSKSGNFEGKNILRRVLNDEALAQRFGLEAGEVAKRLETINARLLQARAERVRPATDDKVLTSWNALALIAFAEAGRYLGQVDYLFVAIRNATFLLQALRPQDRLLRSWRNGQARHPAYLEDYAALILGLLALYQSDPNPRWYVEARALAEEMLSRFADPAGGFFDTPHDHEALLFRPKEIQDNATPSGNALAASALLQLAAYEGQSDWRALAEEMLAAIQPAATRYPTAFAYWLNALDFALAPIQEVAILGDPADSRRKDLTTLLWSRWRPNLVAAISDFPPSAVSPALLQNRPLLQAQPTAYVCRGFVCQPPVTTPEALAAQLEGFNPRPQSSNKVTGQ